MTVSPLVRYVFNTTIAFGSLLTAVFPLAAEDLVRPPAVPLVACDPYFSIWSQTDCLAESDTTHWTGKPHPLTGLLRVDGKSSRLMGAQPAELPALKQTRLRVLPTRTVCEFEDAGLAVIRTFTTPALPEDLDLLSRPVTYLTADIRATDGEEHAVQFYFDASGLLAVNEPGQAVARQFALRWMREARDGDHYRLAFDKPGTWSQKYNLVWDRILGLQLFSDEVCRTEMAHYRRVQNAYGLPLDNRQTYTKLDWVLWTATLTQDRNDFVAQFIVTDEGKA